VTVQRIKGLTAGSLPTFIDASENFASPALREDNWLTQAMSHGRRTFVVGDDTWARLFPSLALDATSQCSQAGLGGPNGSYIDRSVRHSGECPAFPTVESIPLPCFNVYDLHSVDDGVMSTLVPAMKEGPCGVARAAKRAGLRRWYGESLDGASGIYSSEQSADAAQMDAKIMQACDSDSECDSGLKAPPYDVIIAHTLGVDHVGHRFGPGNDAMR